MGTIRVFISIEPPEAIKINMERLQRELLTSGADVKWERPGKFHLTIKFLGLIEEENLTRILGLIEQAALIHPPFGLTYAGIGCFPNLSLPRVIWIGCQDNDGGLQRLRMSIDRILFPEGFMEDKEAFHPHVTLGRSKGTQRLKHLTPMLENLTFEPRRTTVDTIFVMRSTLKPGGSEYLTLREIQLKTTSR